MGLGLSKPQQPIAVAAFAASVPAIYTQFLRVLESEALKDPDTGSAAVRSMRCFCVHETKLQAFGNKIKAYGCPFFLLGHFLVTSGKQRDFMDASYFTACSALSAAFMGTHTGNPFPEGVGITGSAPFGPRVVLFARD